MFKNLMKTENDLSALVLRVMLGVVFFPHGAQKMLGWYGGGGFSGTMQFFTQTMGIPAFFGFLAIIAEFFGSIALLLGLLSRVAAMGIAVVMVVAVILVHAQNGFFMNWNGTAQGEGYEYHLLVLTIAVVVMMKGSGALSVDRLLVRD